MKQQINLFLPEFRVEKDNLTAAFMGRTLMVASALLFLISAVDLVTRWQLNGNLADLREVLLEETRKTDELDVVLARRSQNVALAQRLQQAESRLAASRQIRDFLQDTQLGNLDGFSEYLKDLSRASEDGISINEFELRNGGASVTMAGSVLDSDLVPRFVANIEAGNSPLSGQHFSPQISRGPEGDEFFTFILSSGND